MHIEQVDFVSIPTRDRARAMAWYRDILGLPESATTAGELETPNVTLAFWEPKREGLAFVANQAGIALRVPDVAASRAELETKGIVFIAETWDSGVCHFAAFRDVDGNVLILHRRYAPKQEPPPVGRRPGFAGMCRFVVSRTVASACTAGGRHAGSTYALHGKGRPARRCTSACRLPGRCHPPSMMTRYHRSVWERAATEPLRPGED